MGNIQSISIPLLYHFIVDSSELTFFAAIFSLLTLLNRLLSVHMPIEKLTYVSTYRIIYERIQAHASASMFLYRF